MKPGVLAATALSVWPARAACPDEAVTASALLSEAAKKVAPDAELATGAVGDEVVRRAKNEICTDAFGPAEVASAPWLRSTCDPRPRTQELIAFRDALVRDVATMPRHALVLESRRETRLALIAIDATVHDDPIAFACAADEVPELQKELALAATIIGRVSHAAETEAEAAIASELGGKPLSEAQRAGLARLQRALAASKKAERPVEKGILAAEAFAAAMTIVNDAPYEAPANAAAFARAIDAGDLAGAVKIVTGLTPQRIPPAVPRALAAGIELARARNADDVARVVKTVMLGPWSEPWLFDINGLVLRPGGDETKFGGEVLIGYSAKRFGVSARGGLSSYQLSRGNTFSDNNRWWGGIDGWGVFGGDTLKGELRLHAEGAGLDSSLGDSTTGASVIFSDETSTFFRGTLLAGARLEPNDRLAAGAWFGGGISYESYEPLRVTPNGGGPRLVTFDSRDTTTLLLEARLRLQYSVVPRWFTARASADFLRYALTRDTLSTAVSATTGIQSTSQAAEAEQIELRARLFADAEFARFGGFVPGVNVGFDLLHRSGIDDVDALVPVFGVAIRRTSF